MFSHKLLGICPHLPPPLSPQYCPSQWPNWILCCYTHTKLGWNFNWLWRFSPRRNSKQKLLVEFELVKKPTQTNVPTKARYWHYSFSFFATETWAKCASTRRRGGRMSVKETGLSAEMKRRTSRNYFARVCEHDWMCARVCVWANHTFLGTKALSAVWKCMLRQKNTVLVFN